MYVTMLLREMLVRDSQELELGEGIGRLEGLEYGIMWLCELTASCYPSNTLAVGNGVQHDDVTGSTYL